MVDVCAVDSLSAQFEYGSNRGKEHSEEWGEMSFGTPIQPTAVRGMVDKEAMTEHSRITKLISKKHFNSQWMRRCLT